MSTKLSVLLLSVAFSGMIYAEGAPAPVTTGPETTPAAEEAKEGKEARANRMEGLIKSLDADKDGILSATEIDAAKDEKTKEKLKALDTSADGTVDAAELEVGKKAAKAKKHDKEHGDKPEKKEAK